MSAALSTSRQSPSRHAQHLISAIALAVTSLCAQASTSGVVISQVFGGGGNSGAPFKNDFVELLNTSNANVSVAGWSVQYASASGTGHFAGNGIATLPNLSLMPGQYLLVSLGSGGANGNALPTFDASGTVNMSGTAGKVILVNTTTGLACNGGATACSAPDLAKIVDLVGFGSTANFYEGTGAAPAPSNTTSIVRGSGGCTDTDHNATDLSSSAPAPHNSASALSTCSVVIQPPASITKIHDIQGVGSTSPWLGQVVTTSGVVTKVNNNGFFMQDPIGDGNALTSDGILVFTSTAPTVSVGQWVQLTATVAEFNTGAAGNAQAAAHTVTELTGPTALSVISSGNSIVPKVITFPEVNDDDLEQVEGMLVTINTTLTASQNYFLGRYGQVTLSAQGRLEKPTNLYRPGSVDAANLATSNALRRILLDDGTSVQNPNPIPYIGTDSTLRAGDTIDSITGVIDYGLATSSNAGLADYKIHPTSPVTFTRVNARTATPAEVGGNIKVGSANVLNFFTTFTNGQTASGQSGQGCAPSGNTSDCRGADNAAEFTRQRDKLTAELAALDADVIGLMELQNNGATAIQNLVDGINARVGAGTYALVPDPATGVGTDAIKVGLIYKPARLSRVGASTSDTDPSHKRPPLIQTFSALNGEKFTVIVNHFKSKGCGGASGADMDQLDGQGCFNDARMQEALAQQAFVNQLKVSTGENRVLLLGDFNAYGQEDPIDSFLSQGYTDLATRFDAHAYSYVFDGESGSLDHALGTAELNAIVTGATKWHVNADEPFVIDYNTEFKPQDLYTATPYKSSDHDPVLVGLNLVKSMDGTPGRDTLMGSNGDDVIHGGLGSDTITGGAGHDLFVYTTMRDGLDTLTDFTPGTDRIDLNAVLTSLGVAPALAISGGHVRFVNSAGHTQIQIDSDGSAGTAVPKALIVLRGVTAAQIQPGRDLGL